MNHAPIRVASSDSAFFVLRKDDCRLAITYEPKDAAVTRSYLSRSMTEHSETDTAAMEFLYAVSQALSEGMVTPQELLDDLFSQGYTLDTRRAVVLNGKSRTH